MLKIPKIGDDILNVDTDQSKEINENIDEIRSILGVLVGIVDYPIEEPQKNENGYYQRWKSGKLVQWNSEEVSLGSYSTATMTGVYRTDTVSRDFPLPFSEETPIVKRELTRLASELGWEMKSTPPSLTNRGEIMLVRTTVHNNPVKAIFSWIAIGKVGGVTLYRKLLNLVSVLMVGVQYA